MLSPLCEVRGGECSSRSAHHHDVAAVVAAGLEKHRIHGRLRNGLRRQRLDPCARPISAPSPSAPRHTIELLLMFWALNGATAMPRRARARQSAVVTTYLPASDVVPATSSADAFPEDATTWASSIPTLTNGSRQLLGDLADGVQLRYGPVMAEFTGENLGGSVFERVVLSGSLFRASDLNDTTAVLEQHVRYSG